MKEAFDKGNGNHEEGRYSHNRHGMAQSRSCECEGNPRQRHEDTALLPGYPFLGRDVPEYHQGNEGVDGEFGVEEFGATNMLRNSGFRI